MDNWWETEIIETAHGLQIILPAAVKLNSSGIIDTTFRVSHSNNTPQAALVKFGFSEEEVSLALERFSNTELVFLISFLSESETQEILAERVKLTKIGLENKFNE